MPIKKEDKKPFVCSLFPTSVHIFPILLVIIFLVRCYWLIKVGLWCVENLWTALWCKPLDCTVVQDRGEFNLLGMQGTSALHVCWEVSKTHLHAEWEPLSPNIVYFFPCRTSSPSMLFKLCNILGQFIVINYVFILIKFY